MVTPKFSVMSGIYRVVYSTACGTWTWIVITYCLIKGGSGSINKRSTQATIVVQQPSLSSDAPAATILLRPEVDARRREDNMRQLLDVANTLTMQEMHDFEMRWASDDIFLFFLLGRTPKVTALCFFWERILEKNTCVRHCTVEDGYVRFSYP